MVLYPNDNALKVIASEPTQLCFPSVIGIKFYIITIKATLSKVAPW